MVGFVVISRFLRMFVELGAQTSLTVLDKRWVGNWWLGFAVFGAICVFWSIWLLGFPKEFPLTKKRREQIEMESYTEGVGSIDVLRTSRSSFRSRIVQRECTRRTRDLAGEWVIKRFLFPLLLVAPSEC